MTIDRNLNAAVAVTRFGLGARPGEIDQARADPRGYLLAQIRPQGADTTRNPSPTTAERMVDLIAYQTDRGIAKSEGQKSSGDSKAVRAKMLEDTAEDFLARLQLGATTPASFRERWALFWLNHFTVSAIKLRTAILVGPFENEAIRPRVFGRFEDLLIASSGHPAMLVYLDEARSIGPDSPAAMVQGQNGKHPGLNENLAREIMELHTVGVEAAYTQADVTEFARAMTGWSVVNRKDAPDSANDFVFRARAHEPGARTIMGKRYAENGHDQALAAMKDLAANPHTAHHIAVKLARHFVADEPPPALVERLTHSYRSTGGDLAALASTLVSSPEAWDPTPAKFKTPYEFLISSWRATNTMPRDYGGISGAMTSMGQKPLAPPSPKGWPDEAQVWCAPDAVVKRMNWSEAFAAQAVGEAAPMQIATNALGERLSPLVAKTIARSETPGEGLSILLMSPEFQRR